MARFGGLFKKEAEERVVPDHKVRKLAPRPIDECSVGDALEEIDAEEASGAPRKILPDLDNPEDELINVVNRANEPRERPAAPVSTNLPEQINDHDVRMDHLENALNRISKDSKPLKDQISKLSHDMDRLAAAIEADAVHTHHAEPVHGREVRVLKQNPVIPEFVAWGGSDAGGDDIFDELPPFQPFAQGGSGDSRIAEKDDHLAPGWRSHTMAIEIESFKPGKKTAEPQAVSEFEPAITPLVQEQTFPRRGSPILTHINHDYLTLVLLMRWIEFLFERLTRDRITLVLDYYVDIGWISENVKSDIMTYARGEMQDVTKYMAHEEEAEEPLQGEVSPVARYKRIEDWRLSTDDHLKSLLFIMKMANIEVDKDKLNSLEQTIQKFKENLEGFHGV